jgi:hypothetical protein
VITKHIYLTYVDEYIGAYNPHTGEVVGYVTQDKFVDFVTDILHKFPEYTPHNVINSGIEEVIRQDIAKNRLAKNLYSLKTKIK